MDDWRLIPSKLNEIDCALCSFKAILKRRVCQRTFGHCAYAENEGTMVDEMCHLFPSLRLLADLPHLCHYYPSITKPGIGTLHLLAARKAYLAPHILHNGSQLVQFLPIMVPLNRGWTGCNCNGTCHLIQKQIL
jgi:hypothetical protein